LKRTEDHRIERPVVLGDFFGGSRWFAVILDILDDPRWSSVVPG